MVDLSKQQLSSVGPMADVENFYPILVIRKASLFAGGRKRDSEEIVLLKNGVFGGRAASCEGSEEPRIDQARILAGPDNSLLGAGRSGILWGQWGAQNWPGAHSGRTRVDFK